MLTDMVRTDSHQLRAVAGDSPGVGAVKVVARAHKTLIRERAGRRLRHQLREYFPGIRRVYSIVCGVAPLDTLPGRVIGTKPAVVCRVDLHPARRLPRRHPR